MRPGYESVVIGTKNGETLIGLVTEESPAAVTLEQPDGLRTVWPRTNIGTIETQPWSFMPEGLEEGLTPQDMADLLEYIATGTK